jgi:hypothetical protein
MRDRHTYVDAMGANLVLQVGSTFVCNAMEPSLCHAASHTGIAQSVRISPPAELSRHMLAPAADSEDILGTIVLVRVEDWLRNMFAASGPVDDKIARQELRNHLDEFLGQLSVLALRGRPVWIMVCPSVEWVAEHLRLAALCRTFTNLLAARLRNLAQINLLVWPESLSSEGYYDRELDRTDHIPFTQAAFTQLSESLVGQLGRTLAGSERNGVSADSARSPELANFLSGLKVHVRVTAALHSDSADVGRILRTAASFSLRGETPTLSDSEADAIVASKNCWVVAVSDRLSDYGASGVFITRIEDKTLVIEAMSLSCTALGKQVEFALLSALQQIAVSRGLLRLDFAYCDSGRNQPMLAYLKSIATADSEQRYVLQVQEAEARIGHAAVAPGAWSLTLRTH